ncbi:hypothetical protein AAKU67_002376 [Oxalobacteraceae bacterium GrIS 2.11]
MKNISALLLIGLFCTLTYADESVKHTCKQPVIINPQSSDVVIKYFNKHVAEYKSCIEKFVEAQRNIAKNEPDKNKQVAANEASETAVKEYNEFFAQLEARNKQAGQDDDAEKK